MTLLFLSPEMVRHCGLSDVFLRPSRSVAYISPHSMSCCDCLIVVKRSRRCASTRF